MKKTNHIHMIILYLAMISIIFYFLHVILGTINYPGYNSFSQAVSDLTSDDSPSKEIARFFSSLYGIFSSFVACGLLYTFRNEKNRILRIGIYLLSIMYMISAIGYALFPLPNIDTLNNFQTIMHILVTIMVVLLTIISLIFLLIAFKKTMHKLFSILTLITFIFLMSGALLSNIAPSNLLGFFERFSVFSVVIYLAIISSFNYHYFKK